MNIVSPPQTFQYLSKKLRIFLYLQSLLRLWMKQKTKMEIFPQNIDTYLRKWTSWRTTISYSILGNCSHQVKANDFATHVMKAYKRNEV